jgi:uncharacterized protein YndB with AHSA1/START domain
MKNILQVTTRGDREIVMSRVFNAPPHLVFEACSKPELVRRWLLGPDGWSMPVCEIDLRVGGSYRYVWRHSERVVATEKFDEAWYPGEAVGTLVLAERDGKTTLTQTMLYDSRETRDAILKSPMEKGVAVSYDRLETVLAAMPNEGVEKAS